jgi:predicted protein tyrosine phosphatase
MNILWCCLGNINRSPTMELYYQTLYPEHNHKSCGTITSSYGVPLSQELVDWADKIYVADIEVYKDFKKLFPEYHELAKTIIMGIPDEYERFSWDLAWTLNVWNIYYNPFKDPIGKVRTFNQDEWEQLTENMV